MAITYLLAGNPHSKKYLQTSCYIIIDPGNPKIQKFGFWQNSTCNKVEQLHILMVRY
jgi:hypothetical protein